VYFYLKQDAHKSRSTYWTLIDQYVTNMQTWVIRFCTSCKLVEGWWIDPWTKCIGNCKTPITSPGYSSASILPHGYSSRSPGRRKGATVFQTCDLWVQANYVTCSSRVAYDKLQRWRGETALEIKALSCSLSVWHCDSLSNPMHGWHLLPACRTRKLKVSYGTYEWLSLDCASLDSLSH
jgi:hypothetical protein